jgi:hypothetical protein
MWGAGLVLDLVVLAIVAVALPVNVVPALSGA